MSSGSISHRLIGNTVFNLAANLVAAGLGFVLVPIILHCLGANTYGVWVLIGSVFSYTSLLQVGLSSAVNRHIPVHLVNGDTDGLRRTTSTATAFFLFTGSLCIVFTVIMWLNFTRWFYVPADVAAQVGPAILVLGTCLTISITLQAYPAILSGYQRYDYISFSRIATLVIRAGLIFILLPRGFGLVTVAVLYGATEVAMAIINSIFAIRLLPVAARLPFAFDVTVLRAMLAYGANTFLYSTGAVILYKTSELLIGAFLDCEAVARYSIVSLATLLMSGLVECFCSATKPLVSELDARAEHARVAELSLIVQKYTLIFTIPCSAFMVIMGGAFLHLWTKIEPGELTLVLGILAIGHLVRLSQYSSFLVLVGLGEHRVFGLLTIAMALASLGGALFALSHGFRLIGVATANSAAMIIFCGCLIPWHFNKRLRISFGRTVEEVWLKAIFATAPAVGLQIAWKLLFPPRTWVDIAMLIGCCFVVTLLGAWMFGLSSTERLRFRQAGLRIFPRGAVGIRI